MKASLQSQNPAFGFDSERLLVAISLAPAALAMLWLVAKARWFWSHNPELQFGWVVLLLCGYLFWETWEKRPPAKFAWTFGGVTTALGGLAVLFLTQVYQAALGTTPASMSGIGAGVLLVVAANLNGVFGWAGVKHFAFAAAFILLALPIPAVLYDPIVMRLQSWIAAMNVEVLNLFGVPAQKTGSLIQLPNCTVGVDEACSGVRSLQSTVMATLFIGYLTLWRIRLKMLLLFVGIALAIFGNVVRSLFLSFTANGRGIEGIRTYHDAAGWSILAFTAAGVILSAWWLSKLESALDRPLNAPAAESRSPSPS